MWFNSGIMVLRRNGKGVGENGQINSIAYRVLDF